MFGTGKLMPLIVYHIRDFSKLEFQPKVLLFSKSPTYATTMQTIYKHLFGEFRRTFEYAE